jgi:hypothetical protein
MLMQVRPLDKTLAALQYVLAEHGKCRSTLSEQAEFAAICNVVVLTRHDLWLSRDPLTCSNKPNAVSTVHPSLKTCAMEIRHHIAKLYVGSITRRTTYVSP